MARLFRLLCLGPLLWPLALPAQNNSEIATILGRLDKLERENQALAAEVRQLRAELAASRGAPTSAAQTGDGAEARQTTNNDGLPHVAEELDVQEKRVEELAQTKVEASEHFPIRLTGTALFNSFLDSKQNGSADYPNVAAPTGPGHAGATLRQTTLGLEFRGPTTVWGGSVHGYVFMDFFTGTTVFNQYLRLRTGAIRIDWKSRSIMVGVEKPIFNPREPASLAQVGFSPLTGAGNLWLWIPQVRFEQDFAFGHSDGLRARLGVVETHETPPYQTTSTTGVEGARPGFEGRFEYFHKFDDERRAEFAAGFHTSTTHALGFSIPSNLYSLDGFVNPSRRVEFTGVFYSGRNLANLGTGPINQGYGIYAGMASAVPNRGGWGQITIHTSKRIDFHVFTGEQTYPASRLEPGQIDRNLMYGVNLFYRLAPNVILAPELSQLRTTYLGPIRINNHYDLALAYFF